MLLKLSLHVANSNIALPPPTQNEYDSFVETLYAKNTPEETIKKFEGNLDDFVVLYIGDEGSIQAMRDYIIASLNNTLH